MPNPFEDLGQSSPPRRRKRRRAFPVGWVIGVAVGCAILVAFGLVASLVLDGDQAQLDRINERYFAWTLRQAAGDKAARPSRQDRQEFYQILLEKEPIFRRHPDWPEVGPGPSGRILSLIDEAERRQPGIRAGLFDPANRWTPEYYRASYLNAPQPEGDKGAGGGQAADPDQGNGAARPTTNPASGEWERKSRAKRQEGLALLEQGRRDQAVVALCYAFADAPKGDALTPPRRELLMELSYRLGVISIVNEETGMARKYHTLAEYHRRDLGWDIERYEAWAEPLFVDTCRRMGIR